MVCLSTKSVFLRRMDTVRGGSGDFKFGRIWDYDGGDLGSVVRASRLNLDFSPDKDENLFNRRSECLTPAMVGKFNEHVMQKSSCFNPPKAEINDQQIIIPFCKRKLEETSGAVAALSDLPMSGNLKSHESSATVEDSVPKEVECTSGIRGDSNGDGLTVPKIPGSKRRKTQQRRIMCVPAAGASWNKQGGVGVPSDLWAWRKYGQKPIKGSPHPRGYYRCSSSKGCPARKQIERSHTDPTMLVITYTADHNHAWPTHRNALAGSTRQNALQHKLQTLPVPNMNADTKSEETLCNLPQDNPPDPNLSPINESDLQKRGPSSSTVENTLDPDQSDAGFDVFSTNQIQDYDFFADLGELPECLRDFTATSDEETATTTVVDPFSLFDWSTSTME